MQKAMSLTDEPASEPLHIFTQPYDRPSLKDQIDQFQTEVGFNFWHPRFPVILRSYLTECIY